jgi:hypothetical protein
LAADDSMRLSMSAARPGELLINIVLTMTASVRGNMDFMLFFLLLIVFLRIPLTQQWPMRWLLAMGCNPTSSRRDF